MARLALLVFGVLLVCAAWLWSHLDLVPVVPAVASGSAAPATSDSSPPLAADGDLVPSAASGMPTPEALPERTAVVTSAKRYMIRGTLTRGGVGQPGRDVLCSSGWGKKPATTVTGRDGGFAFEVTPGKYELYAPHMLGITRQQSIYLRFPPSGRERLAAAQCSCVVEASDVAVAMQLPQLSLIVTVRNAKTYAPITWATVAWRPPIPEQDELRVPVDVGGRVRFSDVTLGRSSVVASARAFVAAEKNVEVVADRGDQVIDFLLQPACAFDVVMVDEQGQAIAVSKAQVIALHPYPSGDAVYPSNRKQFLNKERALVTQFDGMSAGLYELHLDDDFYGLAGDEPTVRFAPCIAKGKHMLYPLLGEIQKLEVRVTQRSYATLRAVNQQGELLNTALQVTFQGSDGVVRRVLPAPWQHGPRHGGSHFEGYMKPGAYSLALTVGDRHWSEPLVVRELLVDHTVRVPW